MNTHTNQEDNMTYTGQAYGHINGSENAYGDSGVIHFSTLQGLQRILNRQPYNVPSYLSLNVDAETERIIAGWVRDAGGYYTGTHGRMVRDDVVTKAEGKE
jgi:hypothetical protein